MQNRIIGTAASLVLVMLMTATLPRMLPAADKTVFPAQDTTTVLRNPLMGFHTYYETYEGVWGSPDWILDTPQVAANCSTMYIRTNWKSMEPTEGNCAWLKNAGFKSMVQSVKARGFRLAFRVICQDGNATPQYVLDAVKASGSDPISHVNPDHPFPDVTNPVWQTKFKTFILAFGAAFNDPAVTDYVDANGLGLWGEGNLAGIPTFAKEKTYYDWHLGVYSQAFTRVMLTPTFNAFWTDPLGVDDSITVKKYGCMMRRDGLGSHYLSDGEFSFMQRHYPQTILIGEPCYSYAPDSGWATDPYVIAKAAPAAPALQTYMDLMVDQAIRLHANTLGLQSYNASIWTDQNPAIFARAVANLGYRLRPTKIVYPTSVRSGGSVSILHIWTNDGVGALPNTNIRWKDAMTGRGKYRLAFALFRTGQSYLEKVVVDPTPEPGDWVKDTSISYTTAIPGNVPAADYDLGVAIVDTTRQSAPAIALAVKGLPQRNGWYILGPVTVTR